MTTSLRCRAKGGPANCKNAACPERRAFLNAAALRDRLTVVPAAGRDQTRIIRSAEAYGLFGK